MEKSTRKITKLFAIGVVLSMMMIASLTPVFAEETWLLTISANHPTWGTTNPTVGIHNYTKYVYGYVWSMFVTATPNESYSFGYWILNGEFAGTGIGEIHAIEIFSDRGNQNLTAIFEESESGDWIQNFIDGDWLMCSRTNWTKEYEDYKGEAQWTKSLTNFTGYNANLSMSYFNVQRVWWGERASEQFWLTYNFTGSNGNTITLQIRIGNAEYLFGLIKGIPQIMVTTNETTEFGGMIAGETFNIYAWQHNNSYLSFRLLAYRDVNANPLTIPINLCEIEFNVGASWFENVSLVMNVKHGGGENGYGFGYFSLILEDFTKETDAWTPEYEIYDYPYYPTIFDLIIGAIRGVMPQWARDTIDTMTSWGTQLFSFIGSVVVSITSTALPYLPYILIFWVIDAGVKSVETQSFQPIGIVVTTIYNFLVTVISTIVTITQTVWDFVKFW